jgi:hypothetical protein
MKKRSEVNLPEQELTVAESVMFQGKILHFVENLGAPMVLKQVFLALRKLSDDAVKVKDWGLAEQYQKHNKSVVIAIEEMEEGS